MTMFASSTKIGLLDTSSDGFVSNGTGESAARPWDSSDPFFSAHARDLLRNVLKCYLQQILIFLGIPGNFISGVVFLKQGVSDRINLLLFSLAVADFTYLLTQLLFRPDCYMTDDIVIFSWGSVWNAFVSPFSMWSRFVSGTLIVVMSVDRCLSVAMPLKARVLLTYRWMVAGILLSYLVPLALSLPYMLSQTVTWKTDPATNQSVAYMVESELFSIDSRLALLIWDSLVLVAAPVFFVVVVVCCAITVVHLRRASGKRAEMVKGAGEKSNTADTTITRMLLFLCIVYCCLTAPILCTTFVHAVVPDYFLFRRLHNTFVVTIQMIFTASCLNSTVNFFSYIWLSSRFRKTLKDICLCKLCKATFLSKHSSS